MKWLILGLLVSGFFLLFLLLPAGRWDWPAAYVCVGITVSGWVAAAYRLFRDNPILFARRAQPGAGTPDWDRRIVTGLKLSVLMMLVLSGLDSGRIARTLEPLSASLGIALYGAGLALYTSSQKANRFFEGMVRHQVEFGHKVIDTGPYAYLRHPGYLGFLLVFSAVPCMLRSVWGAWGLLPILVCFVWRILKEESFLHQHLDGYEQYCQRVRSRLIPLLW